MKILVNGGFGLIGGHSVEMEGSRTWHPRGRWGNGFLWRPAMERRTRAEGADYLKTVTGTASVENRRWS